MESSQKPKHNVSEIQNDLFLLFKQTLEAYLSTPQGKEVVTEGHDEYSQIENLLKKERLSQKDGEVLFLLAAQCGLFTKSLREPQIEKRDYCIRQATTNDLESLVLIEKECWAKGLQTNKEIIKRRLEKYPEGQFVLELNGEVVGSIYSQRIQNLDEIGKMTSKTAFDYHSSTGSIVQFFAVNILPKFQSRRLGDDLLEFMLQKSALDTDTKQVAAVTLCKEYNKEKGSLTEYIHARTSEGFATDPILRFHELHGGMIQDLVPGYRPEDKKNEGAGVLILYDIQQRERKEVMTETNPQNEKIDFPEVEDFLGDEIKAILGSDKRCRYSPKSPLMEMGLDSTDLLVLGEKIHHHYHLMLDPAFFFSYNTVEKIQQFLASHLKSLSAKDVDFQQKVKDIEDVVIPNLQTSHSAIAIIGLACQLPGGIETPEKFWEFLKEGKSAIGQLPAGRWVWPDEVDVSQCSGIDRGGFLEDITSFDARFFRITPKEAELMDPQQRIALELAWETIESAGYSMTALAGSNTGVFLGASGSDYQQLITEKHVPITGHSGLTNALAILPNRISYFFDFHGPSLQLDTACSSSMVALYEAIKSLREGECSQALVGGIHVMCHPTNAVAYYKAGMLSPDGECRPFDHRANGYVRSEGAIMLMLKPLEVALFDNDHIWAIVRGASCNHGGMASGLTVPNPELQAELSLAAWIDSGVSPYNISYIEAHGTGTPLGDPVEIRGLKEAFAVYPQHKADSCGIGSVKSNLGHLEAASGLAGLLKVVLALKHGEIPASIHFEKLNPYISFEGTPLYFVGHLTPWKISETTRKAGVSSFGSGGTNAHVILEEYLAPQVANPKAVEPLIFVLSAKTEERLKAYAQMILEYLCSQNKISLESLVYTLQRREAMEQRIAFEIDSLDDLKEKLADFQEAALSDYNPTAQRWVGGGKVDWNQLYEQQPPLLIDLPHYPFAKEHYWLPEQPSERHLTDYLHPLLQKNISDFKTEQFSSAFTGQEFFLKDHVVNGHRILPAVAYLEMVQKALRLATNEEHKTIILKDAVWMKPIIVDNFTEVIVKLIPGTQEKISCQVYAKELQFQCRAELKSVKLPSLADLDQLQSYSVVREVTSNECYEGLKKMGFGYGPSHQTIESLKIGEKGTLAKLHLPEPLVVTLKEYHLHPSLMDGALQAAVLFLRKDAPSKQQSPLLPFAVDSMEIYGASTATLWAWVTNASEASKEFQKLDLAFYNDQGKPIALMKGFTARSIEEKKNVIVAKSTIKQEVEVPTNDAFILQIQRMLQEVVSKVLRLPIDQLDSQVELSDLGCDSIDYTEIADELSVKYALDINPTIFFEFPTLAGLARHLSEKQGENLAKYFVVVSKVAEEKEKELAQPRFKEPKEPSIRPKAHVEEPVAIIGMSGAFPMAHNIDEFWQNLVEGKDCISEIPPDRWDWREYWGEPTTEVNKTNVKYGGFLDTVPEFDPLFFGISPREALSMDPQQRLLMQYAWTAIEDAGYSAESLSGSNTGIFIGTVSSGYQLLLERAHVPIEGFTSTGTFPSVGPNRMSYFLNLHGASEPIETACSSSLVTIHHAILAIQSGEIDQAIVGGVNTLVTPEMHISFNKAGMLSEDGRCKTFSKNADGYGRGEGVGMLFLKRLSMAEADGDHIYGIIRSSVENHGGRSNSLTAPNPRAQADLLIDAYRKAGVDPRAVSYIEAHGTGTKLGDPIEVNALKTAFEELYQEVGETVVHPHCGLGTVKSNIGHLEFAAGVAGVIKVLLQMQHKTLIKTLHAEEQNPLIEIKGTPFYIVREQKEWAPLKDKQGDYLPRFAGVSSFGFGGVNSHVVLEEYIAPQRANVELKPYLIPISAKNKERLKEYAQNILQFLHKQDDVNLVDLAYTMQIGREAMNERLLIICNSRAELQDKLEDFLEGVKSEGLFQGDVKQEKGQILKFDSNPDLRAVINKWLINRQHIELAELWVKGLNIDWQKLYTQSNPQRISLPTYPFARERYWISKAELASLSQAVWLHPLLQENISTFSEEKFKSRFSGEEFFLKQHVIQGHKVLPGVAYLEMACKAIKLATEVDDAVIEIKNTLWTSPTIVEENEKTVELIISPNGEVIDFEFFSGEEKQVSNCSGKGLLSYDKEPFYMPLESLKQSVWEKEYDANICYKAYDKIGIQYGPDFQSLENLKMNAMGILAKLRLPAYLNDTLASYELHPSLLDGALQASIGFQIRDNLLSHSLLPFSLESIKIYGPCESTMWAWVQPVGSTNAHKLNIDFYADSGRLSARLEGLLLLPFENGPLKKQRDKALEQSVESKLVRDQIDIPELTLKIQERMREIAANLLDLRLEDVDPESPFSEFGFDSLTLTEFANELNNKYGFELTPAIFFEYPTLANFAAYLSKEQRATFVSHFAIPVDSTGPLEQEVELPKPNDRHPRQVLRRWKAEPLKDEPIAIVGMSGAFPMANNLDEFWKNLLEGKDCVSEIPSDRWDWKAYWGDPVKYENKSNVKWGGFLDIVAEFDPLFFGISPREALLMDPQQRLLMQYAWQAIEDAGYSAESLSGSKTGMFIATMNSSYHVRLDQSGIPIEGYTATGEVASVGPNRMSYFLNLHGPSEPIETACSSSLLAIHRAVRAIQANDCDQAIVGGVNVLVDPELHISFNKAGMLSEDGRCKTFSKNADGYGRGEGVGMLFLKKLSAAEASGDHIYALIRSTAENHGGKATSLTAPNPKAQAALLIDAYTRAKIDPRTVSYIEAHGTGTRLGDPVEISGLKAAFFELYKSTGDAAVSAPHCGLGTVKSNIGHLELAAGIAGVIKVVLQMKHQTLVKTLHSEEQNPYIDLEGSPLFIVRENKPWVSATPRIAGISGFSFGGANVHVVLEEYVPKPSTSYSEHPAIIILSAKNKERLHDYAKDFLSFLNHHHELNLTDLAYTLQVGRTQMDERLGFVVNSIEELKGQLAEFDENNQATEGGSRRHNQSYKEAMSTFDSDTDFQETIEKWILHKKYGKLLEFWINGGHVDWTKLYVHQLPQRVSLPTYPFAKERYWVEPIQAKESIERKVKPKKKDDIGLILAHPIWKERKEGDAVKADVERHIMEFNEDASLLDAALSLFAKIREIIEKQSTKSQLLQIVIYNPLHQCLSGLLRTALQENPRIYGQTILLESRERKETILDENKQALEDVEIKYESGRRFVKSWEEISSKNLVSVPWKDEGVYLITGGAGGLGFVFAHEIASKAKRAKILLVGRSAQRPEIERKLAELSTNGCQLYYYQGDISDKASVENLIHTIVQQHGQLHGILHAAGVAYPNYLINKSEEEFKSVLQAKISGTICLDEATKDLHLDMFIFFSSISALGMAGEGDYALANAFMDGYAQYRQDLVLQQQRHGHSLSINWPFWEEGGMKLNEGEQKQMFLTLGTVPLRRESGLYAFSQAWTSGFAQVMVLEGVVEKLRRKYLASAVAKKIVKPLELEDLQPELQNALKELAAKLLKIKVEALDSTSPLSDYGFDSISLTEFANKINEKYELELTPAIFFEYSNLEDLSAHLSKQYGAQLAPYFSISAETQEVFEEVESGTGEVEREFVYSETSVREEVEPIAIVGMSGTFPMAHDLKEFWQNLLEGKDCISEIPSNRWDWRAYWGDPTKEANKTNVKWGGFVDTATEFDPLFFGISPREALLMDPQQRLLMEYVWLALEDAGYSSESLSGSQTGIFIGTAASLYGSLLEKAGIPPEGYNATGEALSMGPGRVSYYLNLHGPSEPIDTACSSALVAIHRAVRAIQAGDCEQAIVGGVNALLTPESFVMLSKAGMLSEDGRCKTFSKYANGYARGEGIGVLFLKKLSQAEADGDHIYALIRGSAENHGGRATSLTAPNAKAQAALLVKAYASSKVDPSHVTYIEAHGTGTELGDPVEVNALKTAFKEMTKGEKASCGLGTVKTNIGHLESAAGIAGVIKVILQMQNKTLIKSLHSEEQNPYIDLEDTPFYIVRENREWLSQNSAGQDIPRIAGVSSFGFGGVNAHVIIEEYQTSGSSLATPLLSPVLILLSARNQERLLDYATRVLAFVHEQPELNLVDLAFTLQVGRTAMEERLGVIVHNLDELKEKLGQFIDGNEGMPGVYHGQAKGEREDIKAFETDSDLKEAVNRWLEQKKILKLVEYWIKGLHVDWKRLYQGLKPQRLSLPTYPFARVQYWIGRTEAKVFGLSIDQHPLLTHRYDTPLGMIFEGEITGEWPDFIPDHKIYERPVVAGAVYLSAILAAAKTLFQKTQTHIKDVQFSHPIIILPGQTYRIQTIIYSPENGLRRFDVVSCLKEENKWVTHVTGLLKDESDPLLNHEEPVANIQKRCPHACSKETVYQYALNDLQLNLGIHFRWIDHLYVGENEILARMRRPIDDNEVKGFVLYPGFIDSIFQSLLGKHFQASREQVVLSIPFSCESFIFDSTQGLPVWVHVTEIESLGDIIKGQITLRNEEGTVIGKISGFAAKTAPKTALFRSIQGKESSVHRDEEAGTFMFYPVWKEKTSEPSEIEIERHVYECRPEAVFEENAVGLLHFVKNFLQIGSHKNQLIQCLIHRPLDFALSGLLRTAHLENPKIYGQVILIENQPAESILEDNRPFLDDLEIKYEAGKRYVRSWEASPRTAKPDTVPWKNGGVYLITGGAGGLGLIFAKEIMTKVNDAKIILVGRSALNPELALHLEGLSQENNTLEYLQCDVTNKKSIEELIQKLTQRYGVLNGVLHAAGIVQDQFILKKETEEFKRVLQPKISGTLYLDEATKELPLDFFILFSSVSAVFGNAGQGDYATANAFMDAFAFERQRLNHPGKTLSFNWPLWKEGGMKIGSGFESLLKQTMGLVPLSTPDAMKAFYEAWNSGDNEFMVLSGDIHKIKSILYPPKTVQATAFSGDITEYLRQVIAAAVKMSPLDIDIDAPVSKYGIDSLLAMEITQKLGDRFVALPKTLLFEYQTIKALAQYFLKNHPEKAVSKVKQRVGKERSDALVQTNKIDEIALLEKSLLVDRRADELLNYDVHLVFMSGQSDRTMVCLHGLEGDFRLALKLHVLNLLPVNFVGFNFPDHNQLDLSSPNLSFGTINELMPIFYALKEYVIHKALPSIDLYGFSCGGGALINAIAVLNSRRYKEHLKKIGIGDIERKKILAALQKGRVVLDSPLKSLDEFNEKHGGVFDLTNYRKNKLVPMDSLKAFKGLALDIVVFFQKPDEMLSNRDDALFTQRLLQVNKLGTTVFLEGNDGGHHALHWTLWKYLQDKI